MKHSKKRDTTNGGCSEIARAERLRFAKMGVAVCEDDWKKPPEERIISPDSFDIWKTTLSFAMEAVMSGAKVPTSAPCVPSIPPQQSSLLSEEMSGVDTLRTLSATSASIPVPAGRYE